MNKVYAARMMSRIGKHGVWFGNPTLEFFNKDGDVINVARQSRDEIPKETFIRGEGRVKVSKSNIVRHTLEQPVETYDDVARLVQEKGHRVASYLLGFDESSYGDVYPRDSVRSLEKPKNLKFWNMLSEIDTAILGYLKERGVTLDKERYPTYNIWLFRGRGTDNSHLSTDNPFTAFSGISTRIRGIFILQDPMIDPMGLEKALWKLKYFLSDLSWVGNFDELNEIRVAFDNTSVLDQLTEVVGKELAQKYGGVIKIHK